MKAAILSVSQMGLVLDTDVGQLDSSNPSV
jgi:hypothetical protein